ncbi:MAG: amidohydrolase family protein [candidate division Zixibacteria bacterium]|nr:amidohydrolase family protein [candidate division Zixibacteria bacterium]
MCFFRINSLLTVIPGLRALAIAIPVILHVFSSCDKGTEPTITGNTIALTNCTLIDGTGHAPILNAAIVISDGLIVAVGPADSTTVPTDARVMNVHGATVLPGFINAHVHSGFDRENLATWANSGVTTVRDLAGPSSFAWKEKISKDPYCALLVAAGPMISVPNGYPLVPWGSPNMLPVNSPEEAQIEVAQLLDSGADIIKLAMESGEAFKMTIPSLTPEEALAAVNAAHQHGTIASAHVLVTRDLARAVEAGVDDIAHMVVDYLPDSIIDVMLDDSVLWVPTLELWHHVGGGMGEAAVSNLRKYVQAGGKIALGTDFDGYNARFELGMPMHEMEWMSQAGMSPMQVIVAGTRNAALACNRLADLGTLEAGKIADVLVVNGNPLEDIHNLANIRLVIHRGVIIRDLES